jgi:predicted nucleotidyltransferase
LAVFGLAIRNDFAPDIDVLIDLAPDASVGLVALQRMRDELTGILGRLVDLLTRNGLNRYLRDEILRDAQVIHAE